MINSRNLIYTNILDLTPHSAYIGRKINARVTQTILRGKTIYTLKGGIVGQSKGRFLLNSKNRKVNANAVNA